ncbi:MAG: hypothetical protein AB1782_20600, partial [Cyanobacteriota bacterium]
SLLLCLNANTNIVFADTVNMYNGTVLKGNIVRITSGLINMKTKEGYRKFTRIQVLNNTDFIEIGFGKKKIIAGKIFFATKFIIEMYTPEGILKIPRWRIRNIVLGHVHIPEEQLQIQLPEQVEKDQKNLQ